MALPTLTALKVELYKAALADGVRKAEMARRLATGRQVFRNAGVISQTAS